MKKTAETELNMGALPKARFAIAFSGGGDSTALVYALRHHNPLILIVNHALREGSRAEAQAAKQFAETLGLTAQILTWAHDNPTTGVQAKARKARYGLMGQACRDAGIEYLLTGHTEDDQAETLLMREARNTGWRGAAGMARAVYAPLWPELACVTLVRPLLGETRAKLRDFNRAHGLSWAEDPSNENRNFTRIQMRDALTDNPDKKASLLAKAALNREKLTAENKTLQAALEDATKSTINLGNIRLVGLFYLEKRVPDRLVEIIIRCAAGTGGPVDSQKLAYFTENLWVKKVKALTLSGAMARQNAEIPPQYSDIVFGPDGSSIQGRHNVPALGEVLIGNGESLIWDGRFQITNFGPPKQIKAFDEVEQWQHKDRCPTLFQAFWNYPKPYRETLPLVCNVDTDEVLAAPVSTTRPDYAPLSHGDVRMSCLVQERLDRMLLSGDELLNF